ncbi:MAG: enoyl-CoA hydratase/isomerase family protein, partial [Acidobacteria bacterium]|nr:enoyl-CoA hydratase/isomerase family protein [Acidobacteriota bacterium]
MITTETRDHVTVVRLEHGKVNAFDVELMRRWIAELARLEQADTRAVVLTGTGTVFSAGVELRRLTDGGREYVKAFLPLLGDAFFKTFTFPKPLVAA